MGIKNYKSIESILFKNASSLNAKTTELLHVHQIRKIDHARKIYREPHRTGFYGLVFIESGKGKISINENFYEYGKNTLLATAPGQIISFEVEHISNGYVIFFMPEFLNQDSANTIDKQYPFFKLNARDRPKVPEKESTIEALFRNINIEFYKKEEEYLNVIKGYLLVLLSLANRYFSKNEEHLKQPNRKFAVTADLEKLVLQYLPERKSIVFLADKLSISSKHLNEIVKQTTGQTTSEYIANIFMQEAKKMLLYSNLTVNEVAYKLNFGDPSYFNKVFKKHFQVTPLEFKNSDKF